MRVSRPALLRAASPTTRRTRTALAAGAVLVLAGCGSGTPSPTAQPAFAWERASIELPADVVEIAPGSSPGMVCSPCHAEQASLLMGLATTDDGLLAVGIQLPPSSAVAYRSTDGRTWRPEPGFGPGDDTSALAAAADDDRRVIVGTRGSAAAAWVSTSAASPWVGAPDDPALRAAGGSAEMRAVVAWNGRFVAAGSAGGDGRRRAVIWTSDDGLAWRVVSAGPAFDEARAYGIAETDTAIVVVGASGEAGIGPAAVWVSDDAELWTRVDAPAFAAGPMRAVTAGAAGFVAVGFGSADDRAVAWTSPDGRTWTAVPTAPSLENAGKPIRMAAVAPAEAGFIAGGSKSDAGNGSGVIWRSSDGVTWEREPGQVSMSGASVSGVTGVGGVPVAIGTSGSPDNDQAAAWYRDPYPSRP